MGQDLYEVGTALEDINDFHQQAKGVFNVGEQPRVRKIQIWKRGLSGLLEGKCGEICGRPKFLRRGRWQ